MITRKQYEKMIDRENARASENKLNHYRCQTCQRPTIITLNVDNGVTPAMKLCPICDDVAFSSMYAVAEEYLGFVNAEWYRPTYEEYLKLKIERGHVEKGGLLLRWINKPARREELTKAENQEINNYRKFRQKRQDRKILDGIPTRLNGQKLGRRRREEILSSKR